MYHFWLALSTLTLLWSAPAAAALRIPVSTGTHIYFKGGDNQRQRQLKVQLPSDLGTFTRASLNFHLSCPDQLCDAWDRIGSLGLVQKGLDGRAQTIELLRFMTPYGKGGDWTTDVSDFLPLLQGQQTFSIFIDTWVGPGHPQGNGWLIDAELVYEEDAAQPSPSLVVPLLNFEEVTYGDPSRSPVRERQLPALVGYRAAAVRLVITGHGQGNAENCAEFCPKVHRVQVGPQLFERRIWRDNCATSVDSSQKGNYFYSRAGWCPGDQVETWKVDITKALLTTPNSAFRYQPEAYENSCRQDSPTCSGCVFNTSCSYDGGLHTEPHYRVSAYALYYE